MRGPGYIAVDLGAGSGRVCLGRFGTDSVEFEVVHRFTNEPRERDGHLRWDWRRLIADVEIGLALCAQRCRDVASLGVDSWGVDYGLVDAAGGVVWEPVSYRDERTRSAVAAVSALVAPGEIHARTGIQVQPFNTLYQLFAHVQGGRWPRAATRLLFVPDLVHHALCGSLQSEATIASTSMLISIASRDWDRELIELLGLPAGVLPELVEAGTTLGAYEGVRVVAPAAHDTASAVAATPLGPDDAFLSSGTWSLLGVETDAPVLSAAARASNLTNEGGAYGTTRLLANIMGLWILESCRRVWRGRGFDAGYTELEAMIEACPPRTAFIEPDDPRFFAPADMEAEVIGYLRETDQPVPGSEAGIARVILESLARRYAATVADLEAARGRPIAALRVIGGGSRNAFLNQATATAIGRPVHAGPVEATALGNLCVQAIAGGRFSDLPEARTHLARCLGVTTYLPA